MTLQEQLKVVAVYDGAICVDYGAACVDSGFAFVKKYPVNFPCGNGVRFIDELKYHTSFDWSMPVAKKVWRELISIGRKCRPEDKEDLEYWASDVPEAIMQFSEKFLFEELFLAITFINENQKKNEQPKRI